MNTINHRRTGAIIPLLAVVITAILAIAALTINSSWFMYNQINGQNTADLSARSALIKIIGDTKVEGRIDRARDLAVRMYELNIDRPGNGIDGDRIRFGNLEDVSAFEPVFIETNSTVNPISAVHVDTPVAPEQTGVKVFLSNFLGGRETVDIVSQATASTRPLDLILCLDASRSMNRVSTAKRGFPEGGTTINEKPLPGSRWFELTDTVALFLDAMREVNPNARIGLVTFGGGASAQAIQGTGVESKLDLDLARLEESLTLVISDEVAGITETLKSYVKDNPALGLGTSLYEGLQTSIGALDNDGASKHIVLLSDGAQAAVPSPEPILAAENAADANVTVHTIGFGTGVKVLGDIAAETGGSTFSALGEDELKEAFASLLARFRTQIVD